MDTSDNGYPAWSKAQWEAMKSLPKETPLHMINLIRVRDKAEYPGDHAKFGKGLSGLDAYRDYGLESAPFLAEVGGKQVWLGAPELVVIGPADEHWDIAFIAEYPDFQSFMTMLKHPGYQQAAINRAAAVADSRLIRCNPQPVGTGFGIATG